MQAWKTFTFAVMLPVRMMLWACGFIFGNPYPSTLVFLAAGAAAFYQHRPNLGGLGVAMVGLLLMWISENDSAKRAARVVKNPFVRADWIEA